MTTKLSFDLRPEFSLSGMNTAGNRSAIVSSAKTTWRPSPSLQFEQRKLTKSYLTRSAPCFPKSGAISKEKRFESVTAKVGSLDRVRKKSSDDALQLSERDESRDEVRKRMVKTVSAPNVRYDETGKVHIIEERLTFKARAQSRIGSKDNISHKPSGGNVCITNQKLTYRQKARSRTNSGEVPVGARRPSDVAATQTKSKTPNPLDKRRVRSEGSRPVQLPLGLRRYSHETHQRSLSDETKRSSADRERKLGKVQKELVSLPEEKEES
ncbi:microtubule-associated protein tau-like [Oscarella lobularis]|uniref:microtubule-associated protein tau-like n=1 Tax=Oscarella lobularis TaxID=121494 RepID=UPI003313EB98